MAENLVSVLMIHWARSLAGSGYHAPSGPAPSCPLPSFDLPAFDFVFELEDAVHEAIRGRRTARNPDVDGNHLIDALHDVINAIEAARRRARTHGEHVLRFRHLVVDLLEDGTHFVDDGAGDDHEIGLPRREPHDLGAEPRDVVV